MTPVAVRVHQLIDGPRAGYVVRCPRTRAAALVDPVPAMQPAFQELVDAHELKLRFVLRTGQAPAGEPTRYNQMLADLGLGLGQDPGAPEVDPFEDVALVGPAPAQGVRAATDAVLLQAGEGTVGVRVFDGTAPRQPRFTVGGSLLGGTPPTAHICGSARVALGAFFVDVLPLSETRVAYRVEDRLFSGSAPGDAHPALLTLDPDTLVYPTRLEGIVSISTVAQERRAQPDTRDEAGEWQG